MKNRNIIEILLLFAALGSCGSSKISEKGTGFNGTYFNLMVTEIGLKVKNIWVKESPSFSPEARKWHEMWGGDAVYLFGGKTSDSGRLNDIYKFSEGDWTEILPSTPPAKRSNMRVSENILFGGIDSDLNYFNDIWEYDPAAEEWEEVIVSSSPTGRYDHSFAFAEDTAVLFGGEDSTGEMDDTWEYDRIAASWTYVAQSTYPAARKGHSSSVSAEGRILLFGGQKGEKAMGDTWIYSIPGSSWTLKFPAGSPAARTNGDICYDKRNNVAVFFGGNYNSALFNDLWVYNYKMDSWYRQYPEHPDGVPEEREMTGFAYDGSEDKAVLFGGMDIDENLLSDTWSYILRSSGVYISQVFDAGGIDTYLNYLNIGIGKSLPPDAEIKVQVAVSSLAVPAPSEFNGPDGTGNSYYTSSSTLISPVADGNKRYFRYRAYLKREIPGGTSDFYLSEIAINYNHEPGSPSLIGPPFSSAADGGVASSPMEIYWNNSADNDGDTLTYELIVATDSDFSLIYSSKSGIEELSTRSNTAVSLSHGNTYYYKIRGYDGTDYGTYSESWLVLIDTVPPAAITYLRASRPNQNGAIKIEWTAPDSGYSYRLGFNSDISIVNETGWSNTIDQGNYRDYRPDSIITGEKEYFIITGLKNATTYYFAVKLRDEAGNYSGLSPSPASKTNSPPEVYLSTKTAGSWGTASAFSTSTLTFKYYVKDPDPEDYHDFDILMAAQVGEPFDIVVTSGITQNYYNWDTREVGNADNYVVKIAAGDQRGLSGEITTSTVKITNYNEPPVINLKSPTGGELWEGLNYIEWSSYDPNRTDTLYYEVLISTRGGEGYIYEDRYVRDFELPYGWGTGNYPDSSKTKVKIIGWDDKGLSGEAQSEVFEIFNTNNPPSEFDIISPQTGSFSYSSSVVFSWNPATDPEGDPVSYTLMVSTSRQFYPLAVEVKNLTSTVKTVNLDDEKIYYWKVQALDPDLSATDSSSVNRFAVDVNPLEILSTWPEDGSRLIMSSTETLKIKFNKEPDPKIPLHEYIKITDNYGRHVTYKYSLSTMSYLLEMVPEVALPLRPSREYTCTVSGSVKDIVGHPVTGIEKFTFVNLISSGASSTIEYPGEAKLTINADSLAEKAYIYLEPAQESLMKSADLAAVSETNTGNINIKAMNIIAEDATGGAITDIAGDIEILFLYKDDSKGFVRDYKVDENYLSIYRLNSISGVSSSPAAPLSPSGPVWERIKTINNSTRNLAAGLVSKPGTYSLRAYAAPDKELSGIVVYPNPFDPLEDERVNIKFILTADSRVTLEIYTLIGDFVYSDAKSCSGSSWGRSNKFTWDGKNGLRKLVANGIYVGRLLRNGKIDEEFMIGVLK